jgi:catechol 2,3-dioxygenase-like lactoylglutathione lyase family enzyme
VRFEQHGSAWGSKDRRLPPRISFITLGVTDLARATRFYADGLRLPRLKSPPGVSFFELGVTWLALYPRDLLAADAGVSAAGSGFPGFSLAHNVRSAEEADRPNRAAGVPEAGERT